MQPNKPFSASLIGGSQIIDLIVVRILFLTFLVFPVCSMVASTQRPNVLYLFTDDHSVRTLGCYADTPDAYRWVKTPNIDLLAREGMRFTTCYTGTKCAPSRGTALTGRLQGGFTRETPYWETKLRELGYYTGMIGKWHWNLPQHGVAWEWSVVWPHYLGMGATREDEKGSDYYLGQRVNINGGPLVPLGGYSTDRYADYAVQFLKERATDPTKPWYLWVCFAGVHGPYTPAKRHAKDYLDAPVTKTPADVFGPRPGKPENNVHFSRWTKASDGTPTLGLRSLDSWVKQYNQAVRSLDEAVGRVLQTLRETGQLENTIIIFTADQGFAWGQHGFRDKVAPYDANLLAPLIVANTKRFPRGAVCTQPVSGHDIIATIHKLTGLQNWPTDGRDFSALLANPNRSDWTDQPMTQMHTAQLYGNDAIVAALTKARASGDWSALVAIKDAGTPNWLMLREGKYKYVRYMYPDYVEELYDLDADPLELTNLAVCKVHHLLLAEMRTKLLEVFASKGATYLELLPPPRILDEPPAPGDPPLSPGKAPTKRQKRT